MIDWRRAHGAICADCGDYGYIEQRGAVFFVVGCPCVSGGGNG